VEKEVTVTMKLKLTEEEYKGDTFQEFLQTVENGELAQQLMQEDIDLIDIKVTAKVNK
jgi:ABC-type uncharacterized transport system involved in gliding motility auxiliary subunit